MENTNNTKNSDIIGQLSANSAQNQPIFAAFPHIPHDLVDVLTTIQTQMASNPHYLEHPKCEYTEQQKVYFRTIYGVKPAEGAEVEAQLDEFFGDDKKIYDRIIQDSKRNYMNLSKQMVTIEANKKIDDTIAYTKAITQMQERLLTIQEKAEGLKQIHEFKNIVLEVLANELTPDQRTGIITRIEAIVKN